jgi:hypothetical protein
MNTKAKRVGPFQRTKSERTVTGNHPASKSANKRHAPYQPTAREQIVLERHAARRDATAPAPRSRVRNDGNSKPVSFDHPEPLTVPASEPKLPTSGKTEIAEPEQSKADASVPRTNMPNDGQSNSAGGSHAPNNDNNRTDQKPRLKASTRDRVPVLVLDIPNEASLRQLMADVGTSDLDFLDGLSSQIGHAGCQGPVPHEPTMNFIFSVVKGVKPNDQLEAMAAVQLAAVHMRAMYFARRLSQSQDFPPPESHENGLNKAARTYAALMEALGRYRNRGEQRITVQNFNVGDGVQAAVIGSLTQGSAAAASDQPHDAKVIPISMCDERKEWNHAAASRKGPKGRAQ